MDKETWRPVIGFEEYYDVSSEGEIRSKDRVITEKKRSYLKRGRLLSCAGSQYKMVDLISGNTRKKETVHRVVATAFLPNPTNMPCINHKNGDKKDNRVENLEWCTYSYNIKHALNTGLRKVRVGGDNRAAKLSDSDLLFIFEETKKGTYISEIAKKLNVHTASVSRILRGKSRSACTDRLGLTPMEPNRPYRRKVAPDEVREIKRLYDNRILTWREIVDKFGYTEGTIGDIVRRRTYKDLE